MLVCANETCENTFEPNRHRRFCSRRCNNQQGVRVFRHKQRQRALEYKGGKCQCCGYDSYVGALDYHHVDPSQKAFEISRHWSKPWPEMKAELDKCILVCANCHREIEGGVRRV